MRLLPKILLAGCVVLIAESPLAPSAFACVLDNQGSLSANGNGDQKNLSEGPSSPGFVPFVFSRVYGAGQNVRFGESFSDLRKNLSAAQLAHPFLWTWGDGTHTTAFDPNHAYRRPGNYVISVFAATPSDVGVWSPFDKARIRIVPAGEVWRDNLGQDFLDFLNVAVIWGGRTVLGLIVLGLALGFYADFRFRRRPKAEREKSGLESTPSAPS